MFSIYPNGKKNLPKESPHGGTYHNSPRHVLLTSAFPGTLPRSKQGPPDPVCPPERAAGTSCSRPPMVHQLNVPGYCNKKEPYVFRKALLGAPSGTRTQDPLIKSQLLSQTTRTKTVACRACRHSFMAMQGYSISETSQMTNSSKSAVKSRIHRARQKL